MDECPVTKAWRILGRPWRLVIIDRLYQVQRHLTSY
jgi:DNA-binding HxlR family transcriptional regulator